MNAKYIETYRKGLYNWAHEAYKLDPQGTINLLNTLTKLNTNKQMVQAADQALFVYSGKYTKGM